MAIFNRLDSIQPVSLRSLFSPRTQQSNITRREEGEVDQQFVGEDTRVWVSTVGALLNNPRVSRGEIQLSNPDNYLFLRQGMWVFDSTDQLNIQLEHESRIYQFAFSLDRKTGVVTNVAMGTDAAGNQFSFEGSYRIGYAYTNPTTKRKEKPNGKIHSGRVRPGQSPWDRIGRC